MRVVLDGAGTRSREGKIRKKSCKDIKPLWTGGGGGGWRKEKGKRTLVVAVR